MKTEAGRVIGNRALRMCWCCGQAHQPTTLAAGTLARCVRCDAVLARGHRLSLDALLALTLTAAFLFAIAQLSEMVTVKLTAAPVAVTFPTAVWQAWGHGQPIVAVIAGVTAIAPGRVIWEMFFG